MNDETIPTFGYRRGEAKIFNLRKGEKLPKGWQDTPVVDTDQKATERA